MIKIWEITIFDSRDSQTFLLQEDQGVYDLVCEKCALNEIIEANNVCLECCRLSSATETNFFYRKKNE